MDDHYRKMDAPGLWLLFLALMCAGCGCKAIDSLIVHPIKVLHEMHENNEGERRKPAPAIHPQTNESTNTNP